ncbi:MAG: hypothetical protein IT330_05850 [Anaerolineae bacterium]|nr:hypothetical protein [Anaerolineae bacterium]
MSTLPEQPRPPYDFLSDPLIFVFLAIGAPITTMLGFLAGRQVFLLAMNTVVIFPFFALAVRRGRPLRAVGLTLAWGLFQTISVIVLTLAVPQQAESSIAQGIEYRAEMVQWIATGHSPENTLVLFLPAQARNFGLLAAASVLTGGLGGLFMIASLINYSGFYIAHLTAHATQPLLLVGVAWPIWSLTAIIGYVVCCVVLAEPLLRLDWRAPLRRLPLLVIGLSLVLLDAIFRLLAGPLWRALLQKATSLG